MLYLRMFLYNLIVRAYNSGEVQLKNMQLEFSTSCSPIFQIHGKLLKLPTNSATGRLPWLYQERQDKRTQPGGKSQLSVCDEGIKG